MSSLWSIRVNLGADGQVDGGVAALILEQLGARRDQPHRRCRRAPDGPNRIWPLAFQPGVRIHGVVGRDRLGVTQVAQFACHLGGLAALAAALRTRILVSASLAGVTSVILDRDSCSPSCCAGTLGIGSRWRRVARRGSWTSTG